MPPTTHYAKSGEVHIAYQVFGEGPDLVMAPGFVSHIENYWDDPRFARWLNKLGSFCRVLLFDKRGTGLSDRVPNLPAMDERMDDVRAVMDAVKIERAAQFGISEGGSLAALFAATHPERTQSLTLYGAFARFLHWIPDDEGFDALTSYIDEHWGTGTSLPNFAPTKANDLAIRQWWGKFERLGASPSAAIYIAAFIPDQGESAVGLLSQAPAANKDMRATKDDFLYLEPAAFPADFAADVPPAQASFMAHSQGMVAKAAAGAPVTTAAWHQKKSWALVATQGPQHQSRSRAQHGQAGRQRNDRGYGQPRGVRFQAGGRSAFDRTGGKGVCSVTLPSNTIDKGLAAYVPLLEGLSASGD